MTKFRERAQVNIRLLGDLPSQMGALEQMNAGRLAAVYRDLYGEPTRSRNKDYLRKRLTWRLQELAHGGLPAHALEKIAALGDGMPERWRIRQAEKSAAIDSPPQYAEPRDPRIPPVGTILRRIHNGTTYEAIVCPEGFEHAGIRFKTLSGIAKHITGTPWNGFLFFGLNKMPQHSQESAA